MWLLSNALWNQSLCVTFPIDWPSVVRLIHSKIFLTKINMCMKCWWTIWWLHIFGGCYFCVFVTKQRRGRGTGDLLLTSVNKHLQSLQLHNRQPEEWHQKVSLISAINCIFFFIIRNCINTKQYFNTIVFREDHTIIVQTF